MKVRAKWNIKGSDGWHLAGEVFETMEDFGNAVEVLDAPKKAPHKAPEPAPAPATTPETAQEPVKTEEPAEETPKRSSSRRKKTSE